MKNKKVTIFTIIVFILGITIGVMVQKSGGKKIVSGYSFEVIKKDVINKTLSGEDLDSFVTVVEAKDEFTINVEGIEESSKVFVISPPTGEMTPLKYENGKFTTKIKLEKDINYAIIKDYGVVGSIRVVEDIKSINEDQLFQEILIALGCGL